MYSSEHAQECSQPRSCSLASVAVYFSYPISIIVPGPLPLVLASLSVPYSRVPNTDLDFHSSISLPFVCVEDFHLLTDRCSYDFQARLGIRPLLYCVSNLSTLAPFDRKDRWAIRLIVSVTARLVGPSSRRVLGVWMRVAFFPPRSGTTHRLPEHSLSSASLGAWPRGVAERACEVRASAGDQSQVRDSSGPSVRLWRCREVSTRLSMAFAEFFQRPYQSIKSSSGHTTCSDKQSSSRYVEQSVFRFLCNEDIAGRLDGGNSPASGCIRLHPTVHQSESLSFCQSIPTAQLKET